MDRAQIDLLRNDTQEALNRLGRCASRTRGLIDAVADHALNAQWRVIDMDSRALHLQQPAHPIDLQREVEPGAEGEMVERPGHVAARAAAKHDVERRARLQALGYIAAGERHDLSSVRIADPRPRQGPAKRITSTYLRAQFDLRTFGRFAQRLDGIGRPHPPTTVRAHGERRDHLAAHFLELRLSEQWLRLAGQRLNAGGEVERRCAKPKAGSKPAKPCTATHSLAKIGDQFDLISPVAQAGAPVTRIGGRKRPLADGVSHPKGSGCAPLLRTELATVKHLKKPPTG